MTPETLAESIRSTYTGSDGIGLSAMSDQDIINQYLRCSCCGDRAVESDTDIEFLILQSNNKEDFDRNVFVHIHGGPLSATEQQVVAVAINGVVRDTLLRFGAARGVATIADEDTAKEVYRNLCKNLTHFIVDEVNRGYKQFIAASSKQ